jgi:excinuclease ABC subunit B
MEFKLTSEYTPTGDQPEAIKQLVEGLERNDQFQTLLGVTGSGKTFTMANVIAQYKKPTLILCHNKTLAAQLYGEFKKFFPENAVEYFVSYYDYYQPEAYLPVTDTFIEKDLSINEEIEKLRLSTSASLLSGRSDVIVVSSVSCLYGIGNPEDFSSNVINVKREQVITRNKFLHDLVASLYARTEGEFQPGKFRVKGDTVDIFPGYADIAYKISFWGDEIDEIYSFDPETGRTLEEFKEIAIYPANIFVTDKNKLQPAIVQIQDDMTERLKQFEQEGKSFEAKRLKERTEYDLEMLRELGYCSGIENYSRYFDGRIPGTRPFCLLDYFPDDFVVMVDESHVTIPQVKAMYGGDRARKVNLVEHGFRLPAAMDNRPLKFEEFESLMNQALFVSATPADYEIEKSEGVIVEQVIRPTGLLDPIIEIRPSENQIDDLLDEIDNRVKKDERVLVTTLTKRMAEELTKYVTKLNINCEYIHSDVDTLERVEILKALRLGDIDVLVGVNLLREGLDLPEVSLVAILDADKEGFLRSETALTQTAGRAARNLEGRVIMYADKVTGSMQRTIDETTRRRKIQEDYNTEHGLSPQALKADKESIRQQSTVLSIKGKKTYIENDVPSVAADPIVQYMSNSELEKSIAEVKRKMEKAAKDLEFIEAAKYRDEMKALQQQLDEKLKS